MKHHAIPRQPGRVHPLGCACASCAPPGPADETALPWIRRLECTVAGFVFASALVQFHAWLTGAPGVLGLLGLVR